MKIFPSKPNICFVAQLLVNTSTCTKLFNRLFAWSLYWAIFLDVSKPSLKGTLWTDVILYLSSLTGISFWGLTLTIYWVFVSQQQNKPACKPGKTYLLLNPCIHLCPIYNHLHRMWLRRNSFTALDSLLSYGSLGATGNCSLPLRLYETGKLSQSKTQSGLHNYFYSHFMRRNMHFFITAEDWRLKI